MRSRRLSEQPQQQQEPAAAAAEQSNQFVIVFHNGELLDSSQWKFCSFKNEDSGVEWNLLRSSEQPLRLLEVLAHRPNFGSWLLMPKTKNESLQTASVVEDGSIYYATPFDPLFIVLSSLERSRKIEFNMFQPLDELLMDANEDFPLKGAVTPSQMEKVCERKDVADEPVFRLSSEAVLKWLSLKLERLEKDAKLTRTDALLLLSDYLPKFWFESLKASCNANSRKVNDGAAVDLAARYKRQQDPEESAALKCDSGVTKKPALSVSQRKLAKVDRTGMSSLSKYFGKPKNKVGK